MKKRLVGIILASLLVVLVGINALAFPVKKAQIPKPQTTVSTQKVLDTLTAKELLPFAQAGNAEAQYHLGLAYKTGDGVPGGADFQLKALKEGCVHPPIFDAEKMAYWFQKAAEQGHSDAQFWLGVSYYRNEGVPWDENKAVYWWQKSAEQGHSDAQFWLGLSYYKNEGVPWDENKAVYWWQKSAEQGNALAQFNLGDIYSNGRQIPHDYKKAVYWYQKSAEQGNAEAQFNLGDIYSNGNALAQYVLGESYSKHTDGLSGKEIPPQDYKKAFHWYQKAAEQGYADAQVSLGCMYDSGQGVPQDKQKAFVWFSLARAQGGMTIVSDFLSLIAKELTPAQLAEAQEWARDWDEKIQAKKAQTPE